MTGGAIGFGSPGWRYKILPSNTDATDYSAPDLDDSSWPVGAMAFGASDNGFYNYNQYGGYSTAWPNQTRIWVRRRLTGIRSARLLVRADNGADIYWNGVLVGSFYAADGAPYVDNPYVVDVARALISSSNVLAIRGTDGDTIVGGLGNQAVLDAKIITDASAVRRWPRDDAAGLTSAARLHPRPKAGRVAGGYT